MCQTCARLTSYARSSPVGLPFASTRVRLLDEAGKELPPGEVGELFSQSPYLFNGYWQRPEETEATLRGDWFSAGDLARRDDEGYLYLVDRKDDKIVSGGINVYPREVEEVLLRHPAVVEAAVFGIPDERWGEAVQAAVVVTGNDVPSADEIIEYCLGSSSLATSSRRRSSSFLHFLETRAGRSWRRELREPHWTGRGRRVS